jgi:AAT family amino acid transporter
MEQSNGYQRGLKSRHVSLIALGGIIGSSYFLGTGYVFNQLGPSIFLAYILGGLITYFTMACLAELTVAVPAHGSFITYVSEFISPALACGVGWSYWVSWVVFIPSECLAAGILMHAYVPSVPVYLWTMLFGLFITGVNLLHVKHFGEMEFWLSLIKIGLIAAFSGLAIFIFFGLIGTEHAFIGTTNLLDNGGLFPNGYSIFFISMVVLLANFQGSEIIGLSASESHDPHKSIPSALKKISYRICGCYLLPTFLLALIIPWQEASLTSSVFSVALAKYGFSNVAHIFSFLIIAGALSCANSGLYATVRSLHALSLRKMAPSALKQISSHGIPVKATLATLAAVWTLLIVGCFFSSHELYANLLALSGFTGSFCWICICWAQLRYRKQQKEVPAYQVPWFPYLTHFAIWSQVICLLVVAFSPTLAMAFYIGVPTLLIPMAIYKLTHKYRT